MCSHPLPVPRSRIGSSLTMLVPCGRCMPCRVNRSQQWSIRLLHELDQHPEGALFVTLTYKEMPLGNSLDKAEFVRFMKRLRKDLSAGSRPGEGRKVKYYACGEYGGRFERPHYHLILFGLGFADCHYVSTLKRYQCDIINDNWGHGFVDIGSVTKDSISYVTKYITKVFMGESEKVYSGREPPFSLMSKGLGLKWAQDNIEQIKSIGIKKNGNNVKIPRYYFKKLGLEVDTEFIVANNLKHRRKFRKSDVTQWHVIESINADRKQSVINLVAKMATKRKKEVF